VAVFLLVTGLVASAQVKSGLDKGKGTVAGQNEKGGPSPVVESAFVYKTANGNPLNAYVYRLPGDTVQPVLVQFHPGALIMGTARFELSGKRMGYKPKLLDTGYTIVSIEYRLAPAAKLAEIIEDVKDAWKWLHENGARLFHADLQRVGVMGTSAGGYLSLMSGFCVTPRPKMVLSISGYGDITGDWYTKPAPFYCQQPMVSREKAFRPNAERDFYLYCRQNGLWTKEVSGHDPAAEPKWFDAYCPLRNVTKDYPPTMLVHGGKDDDVPYEQSVLMDKELTAKGVEHQFVSRPDGGHGVLLFAGPPGSKIGEQIVAFVEKHLRR
jgi:acetyl esterase/lipase